MPLNPDENSLELKVAQAIRGIMLSKTTQPYICENTHVYVLPVDFSNNGMVVMSPVKGIYHIHTIGFYAGIKHYSWFHDSGFTCGERRVDTLYLPLIKTKYQREIFAGKIANAFGIEGAAGILPLVLAGNALDTRKEWVAGLFDYKGEVTVSGYIMPAGWGKESASTEVAPSGPAIDWSKPTSIVAWLNDRVVGQHQAKKIAAVAFSNFYARMLAKDESLPKSNVLMVGPTGVGKTLIVSLLAQEAKLPYIEAKMTGKSVEGYVGTNFSRVFLPLMDLEGPSPYAVVFLDELDKVVDERYFGDRLQTELVGLLENGVLHLSRDREPPKIIYTDNILFFGAGAFSGTRSQNSLQAIIRRRIGGDGIGFHAVQPGRNLWSGVTPDDLIEYGLMPELVGRFPMVASLDELSVDQKVSILWDVPDSIVYRNIRLFEVRGYDVKYRKSFAEEIAWMANPAVGARGLEALCGTIFTDLFYDPGKYSSGGRKITLDRKLVRAIEKHQKDPGAAEE